MEASSCDEVGIFSPENVGIISPDMTSVLDRTCDLEFYAAVLLNAKARQFLPRQNSIHFIEKNCSFRRFRETLERDMANASCSSLIEISMPRNARLQARRARLLPRMTIPRTPGGNFPGRSRA